MKRHGARYKARRRAVDLLYEAETRDIDPVALIEERASLARIPQSGVAPIADYTRQIVEGAAVSLDALDEIIEGYLTDDWELRRIAATDRAILRVAVWELIFNPDVPLATAVVEGTELASQYSGPVASAYINAMLDRVRGDHAVLRIQYAGGADPAAEGLSDDDLADSVLGSHIDEGLPTEVEASAPSELSAAAGDVVDEHTAEPAETSVPAAASTGDDDEVDEHTVECAEAGADQDVQQPGLDDDPDHVPENTQPVDEPADDCSVADVPAVDTDPVEGSD